MRVIILGAGEVGYQIARYLSMESQDVIVIDRDKSKLNRLAEDIDVAILEGEVSDSEVLRVAGADRADMVLAVTDSDEANMIACLLARTMFNVPRRIARIRNPDHFGNKQLLSRENLDINPAINPEYESAEAVTRLLRAPFASTIESFEDGLVYVVGCKLPESSPLAGKSLKEVPSVGHRLLFGLVERGDEIFIPGGNDVLQPGDIVYLPVPRDLIAATVAMLGIDMQPVRRVIINGGGRIGYAVAAALERTVEIKIIDTDLERCKYLSKQLHRAIVLYGDGSEQRMLSDENIAATDVYISVTNNDELNIIACLLAKKLGVSKTIAVVNRTDYVSVAHGLGLHSVLSPRLLTASSILRYVRQGEVLSLTAIADGRAEILETRVGKNSQIIGVRLKDLRLPSGCVIGAIIRGPLVIIPGGNDAVAPDDKVIVFVLRESIRSIEQMLA
ncbi:MAG: trk system potassium uptake protein TrkA [Nitrospirae bacterium]|nr:MAG: trk system potassium uptake protein TrkA [Nitrospirota bacterium]